MKTLLTLIVTLLTTQAMALVHSTDQYQKITDNSARGPVEVSGIRNMREVIPGIMYRSGSVGGQNPLNEKAVQKLCKQGFSIAFYDYNTGMKQDRNVPCGTNEMMYRVKPSLNSESNIHTQLAAVYDSIKNHRGPVLTHCWNGWHASGYVSAAALIQFCGYTNQQALAYWIKNTDGASNYPSVKAKVLAFRPYGDLQISGVKCFKP